MRILAVDFGTSNTVAALSVDGAAPRLVSIDGSPLVPSCVFRADDGTLVAGRDADRQARIDPSRFEPNPKRRIDEGAVLLGQAVVPVTELIAAVLRLVAAEVGRQLGGAPDEVRLTHPARWGERRRQVLVDAARSAGLGSRRPVLLPEPVAAARHFAALSGSGPDGQKQLAVYDLGGGTFDVAVVRRIGAGYDVTAEAGLPDLGGVDFDQAIVEHIGATHARAVDAGAWARLLQPVDAQSRRQQRALLTDVRDGKEALSRYPHTDIALPPPFTDVHLTRAEFEDLIRANLSRSVRLLSRTITDAGAGAEQLAGIYLVGGSSRIPLVGRLIQQELGVTPTTLDQPETSVATGALYLPEPAAQATALHRPQPPRVEPAYRAAPPPIAVPRADPAPPPSAPRRRRRGRWVVAAAAVLVIAGAALVTSALRGGSGADEAGNSPPPVSIVPGAGTCTENFQNCLDSADLRTYVQPAFGDLRSCKKNDAFGVSNLVSSGVALATCTFKNGYEALFVKVNRSDVAFYRGFLTGSLATQSSLSKQNESTWSGGRLISYTQSPHGAGLYWDKEHAGILGLAESPSASPGQLQNWWHDQFRR